MICKKCGKKFHHCSNCCDSDPYTDRGFCSLGCWTSSDEYLKIKKDFLDFWNSLNVTQKAYVLEEQTALSDEDYSCDRERWIQEQAEHLPK